MNCRSRLNSFLLSYADKRPPYTSVIFFNASVLGCKTVYQYHTHLLKKTENLLNLSLISESNYYFDSEIKVCSEVRDKI